jgi:hypothetical protein
MDVEKALNSLWQSIQRVGNHFGEDCLINEEGEGYRVILKTSEPLPSDVKRYLLSYMTSYLDDCGWKLSQFKLKKGYATFLLRAASNRS